MTIYTALEGLKISRRLPVSRETQGLVW